MSDSFVPFSATQLFHLVLENEIQILGIPIGIIFDPRKYAASQSGIFFKPLGSPVGVAAGPHTQLAPNIITAWLCGARYIELKTIQTLDELEIPKPCIDMQDEGYNCEWSQELKIHQSFEEYLKAWIFIHLLNHKFGFGKSPETVFNMSVGYDYQGIQNDNVQWFFSKMQNCRKEKEKIINELLPLYPELANISIPDCISDNITLSTMHGCPPDEIEKIGTYLLTEKKLHTYIKLNPTLVGTQELREILNNKNKYFTHVPDEAFQHDIDFSGALKIIASLQETALKMNLDFGVKLTNTLESINNKEIFTKDTAMMYMSGRALHPISMLVAKKLQLAFDGKLAMSFSGGADVTNVAEVLACGIYPVTVCSDILKPGGYGRLTQYFDSIEKMIKSNGIETYDDYQKKLTPEIRKSLVSAYAEKVLKHPYYQNDIFGEPSIKTTRKLHAFDCIAAPCINTCPTNQDIPDYLHWTSQNKFSTAREVIMRTNPLPAICGMACDHECETKCTRINYDQPLLIKEIKRFITENSEINAPQNVSEKNIKVSVIGAGPAGLSCAYFLRQAGLQVEVYETKPQAGGMVSNAIPGFRISKKTIFSDVSLIEKTGVKIHYNSSVTKENFESIKNKADYLFIGVGAQKAKTLEIKGSSGAGIVDPLQFLAEIKSGTSLLQGTNIAVIGGGNTAMDVVRTAKRLLGKDANVMILYRRSIPEMPADKEEIKAALLEGIQVQENVLPIEVIEEKGKLTKVCCIRTKIIKDAISGKATVTELSGTEFIIPVDTIIPALGQEIVTDFLNEPLRRKDEQGFQTQYPNIYFGGDVYRGPANIIKAIADGKNAAFEMLEQIKASYRLKTLPEKKHNYDELMKKRQWRVFSETKPHTESENIRLNECTTTSLTTSEAVTEAARCLYCDELCNICVTVCPNRANYSYKLSAKPSFVYHISQNNGSIGISEKPVSKPYQDIQVLNITDLCNECGNCVTFCPTTGKPWKDKPRFFINRNEFERSEEGYCFAKKEEGWTLIKKSEGNQSSLTIIDENFHYKTNQTEAIFSKDFTLISAKILTEKVTTFELKEANEMYLLFQALQGKEFFKCHFA